MTGLERWALDHNTTAQEIQTLTMAENPDGWRDILGKSLDGPDALPSGRGTALSGMLQRGRAGDIKVTFGAVAGAMGCSFETVANAVTNLMKAAPEGTCDGCVSGDDEPGLENAVFDSARLPALILAVRNEQGPAPAHMEAAVRFLQERTNVPADTDTPDAEPDGNASGKTAPETKTPKAKKASRRGKYSIGKQALSAMLRPEGASMPIREIRAFLVSLPGSRPMDIAVMTDAEVSQAFAKDYTAIWMGSGAVIMPSEACTQLIDFLGSVETYYIPGTAD